MTIMIMVIMVIMILMRIMTIIMRIKHRVAKRENHPGADALVEARCPCW